MCSWSSSSSCFLVGGGGVARGVGAGWVSYLQNNSGNLHEILLSRSSQVTQ